MMFNCSIISFRVSVALLTFCLEDLSIDTSFVLSLILLLYSHYFLPLCLLVQVQYFGCSCVGCTYVNECEEFFSCRSFYYYVGFPVAQLVKNPPAVQETWIQSLGEEDPLEKGKATHSSILAWRVPWTVQSMGSQRVGHD